MPAVDDNAPLDYDTLIEEIENQFYFHGTLLKGEASGILLRNGDFLVRKLFVKGEMPKYSVYVKMLIPKAEEPKKEPQKEPKKDAKEEPKKESNEPDNPDIRNQKVVVKNLKEALDLLDKDIKNKKKEVETLKPDIPEENTKIKELENDIHKMMNEHTGKSRELKTEERILEELKDEARYSYILDYEMTVINEQRIGFLDKKGEAGRGISERSFQALIYAFQSRSHYMPVTKTNSMTNVVLKNGVGRSSWEMSKDVIDFSISNYMGKGSFGRVCRGTMIMMGGGVTPVAVKVSLTPEQQQRLEEEEKRREEEKKKKEAEGGGAGGADKAAAEIDYKMTKATQEEAYKKNKATKEEDYKKNKATQGEDGKKKDKKKEDFYKPTDDYQKKKDYELMKAAKQGPKVNQEQWVLDFFKEVKAMRDIVHPNLVKMIGAVIESDPPMLILELVDGGTLRNYLVKMGYTPSREKKRYALHAAWGIEYLHSRKIIHRDIAARNCLLHRGQQGEDFQLKISDFGMSRIGDSYTLTRNVNLPVKWMAPESIDKSFFSRATDVWSFGCLLYEIYTDGKAPYANLTLENVKGLYKLNTEDHHLPTNLIVLHEHGGTIANHIASTHNINPDNRPTMSELAKYFEEINDDALPPVAVDKRRAAEAKQKAVNKKKEDKRKMNKLIKVITGNKAANKPVEQAEATEQGSKMVVEQNSKMKLQDDRKKVLNKKRSNDRPKVKKSAAAMQRNFQK